MLYAENQPPRQHESSDLILKRRARVVTTCEYAAVAYLGKGERVFSGSGRYVPNLRTSSDRVGLKAGRLGSGPPVHIRMYLGSNNFQFPGIATACNSCIVDRGVRARRAKEEARPNGVRLRAANSSVASHACLYSCICWLYGHA
jgi:hypothetical protein